MNGEADELKHDAKVISVKIVGKSKLLCPEPEASLNEAQISKATVKARVL